MPEEFEALAIARHDACCNNPSHHQNAVPQQKYPEIGQYLRTTLGHSVLAADLTKDNLEFHGAAICPVGTKKAAHLIFGNNAGEAVSVISLPAGAYPVFHANQTYTDHSPDGLHTLAVRCQDGAIYCLVGSSPKGELNEKQLNTMLASHLAEASVREGRAGGTDRETVAGWVGHEH